MKINSESEPLLAGEPTATHDTRRGTIASSMFNLMMSAVGAGLLSFPYAMASSGLGLTIFWTALFAFFVAFTLNILVRMTQKHRQSLKVVTLEELVHLILGEWGYRATVVAVLGGQMGSLIGYTIIIADFSQPVLQLVAGEKSVVAERWFIVLAFSIVVMLPLSMFEDIHSLAIPSALGVASVLAVFGILTYRALDAVAHHTIAAGVVYGARSGVQLFLAPPICLFALGMHLQGVSVTRELPEHLQPKMPYIVIFCQCCCFTLYVLTGFFGYLLFGPNVQGDVLKDFPLSDIAADVAKILMGIHVSISYPVCLYPAKRAVLYIMVRMGGKERLDWKRSLVTSLVVIAITGVVAVLVPQVSVVFGLATTSFGVWVVFIAPGLLVLQEHRPARLHLPSGDEALSDSTALPQRSWWQVLQCVVLLMVGVLMAVVGTAIIIQQNWIH
eukprot:TRINITY_DN608_c3_g2_i2.p1 TRINITY_DN608_c3_g2~~TRINITY_DN608_c3_g2_i2.p1  ORF type:complete len:443 (-),score=139.57 TRINITY_DN608_c3_g2_i2:452-1780(-)